MKRITQLFLLLISLNLFAQNQNLASLAKGDYLGFNAVFDQDDNLFGYVALYGYGKSGDKTKKFEYVILDKNLNPVANKEFEGDITAANYYAYMDFKGDIILRPSEIDYYAVKQKDLFAPSSMQISPKENLIKRKVYYDYEGNGKFIEIKEPKNWKQAQKETKNEKREKGYNFISGVYEIKEGGFLVIEYKDYGKYINNNCLSRFDENKKEIWKFRYNTDGTKKINEQLNVIEKDEKNIYCILQSNNKTKKSFYLLVIDMKTGKELHRKEITKLTSTTLDYITSFYGNNRSIDNDKTFDDKIVLMGWNFKNDNEYFTGFARVVINKSTFEVEETTIDYENDLNSFIPKLGSTGMVENGYQLMPRDLFFMNDGSIGILMEKFKYVGNGSMSKTTDLVYIYTDKDFKVKGVKIFDKEKTKSYYNSDYLFSQYLNNGKDVVFFYRDYQKDKETKEKNWNLFINTLIGGEFRQEQVPISQKDNFFVSPYVAKQGYILLHEYNKKDKYNQVRLERLNY